MKLLEFKPIEGYEDLYLINRNGEIYSCHSKRLMSNRISPNGYAKIGLRKNGIKKFYSIHRLVAKTFIENPLNKPCVNHMDCNKLNNKVENLEWVTESENMQHAKANGLVNTKEQQLKLRDKCGYLKIEDAINIREIYKNKKLSQRQIGLFFNVSEDVIYHIVNNHTYKEVI